MVAEQDFKHGALETSCMAETDCNSFVVVRGLVREVATVRVEYIRLWNSLCSSGSCKLYSGTWNSRECRVLIKVFV